MLLRSATLVVGVPRSGLTTARLLLLSTATAAVVVVVVVVRTRAAIAAAAVVVAADVLATTVVRWLRLAAFAIRAELHLLRLGLYVLLLRLLTAATTATTTAAVAALLTLRALALALRSIALVLLLTLVVVALPVWRTRREGDALARIVDLEHADFDLLADLHDLGRILHERFGELRDVDEAIVVDPDIDERTERGDVRDEPLEHHADLEVFHAGDVVTELRRVELGARVPAWLAELADDVAQRRLADVASDVLREIDLVDELLVADEIHERRRDVRRHLLDELVALGVNRRAIERVRATANPQEARGLLERLGPEARDVLELPPRAECAVRIAMQHDLLRE